MMDLPTPLQSHIPWLPDQPPLARPLPGARPLEMADWLLRDEAFAEQMALKQHLLMHKRSDVLREEPGAEAATEELLTLVLEALDDGYRREGATILRPDGVQVELGAVPALEAVGHLVQSDMCLMAPDDAGDWSLQAALLCFPASWCLDEKIGRGLGRIHHPVDEYDDNVHRRVSRLFDAVHPDRPLWRYNLLVYDDPALFAPRPEDHPRADPVRHEAGRGRFLRSERQTLRRLPRSGWVVFGIHTVVVPLTALTASQRAGLDALSYVTD